MDRDDGGIRDRDRRNRNNEDLRVMRESEERGN